MFCEVSFYLVTYFAFTLLTLSFSLSLTTYRNTSRRQRWIRFGQDTLYKQYWSPDGMTTTSHMTHSQHFLLVHDFMLQNLIHFYSSLNICFTISLSLIVMTLQLLLIPFVVVHILRSHLSFGYELHIHPPYLSFSLSLTTYRNTSRRQRRIWFGHKHCTNTIRVLMVWLRLVIQLVLNTPTLPIRTLRSPWHQVVEDLVSFFSRQLNQHLQGPVHQPLLLNQMSPQLSQTPCTGGKGALTWGIHWGYIEVF